LRYTRYLISFQAFLLIIALICWTSIINYFRAVWDKSWDMVECTIICTEVANISTLTLFLSSIWNDWMNVQKQLFWIWQEVTARVFMPLFECPSQRCKLNKAKGNLILQLRASKFLKFQEVLTFLQIWPNMAILLQWKNQPKHWHVLDSPSIILQHCLAGEASRVSRACTKGPHPSFSDCSSKRRAD
jgi:hypothetical protein